MNNRTKIILLGISVSLLMAGCNNMTEAKKNVTAAVVGKENTKIMEGDLYMQPYVDWLGNNKSGPLSQLSVIELEELAAREDMAGLLDAGKEESESSEEQGLQEETQPKEEEIEVAIEESEEKETEAITQEEVTEEVTTEEVTATEEVTTEPETTEPETTEEVTAVATEDVTQASSEETMEESVEDTEPVKPNGLVAPFSISFLGDSITVGYYSSYSYADVVCEDLVAGKYNYGISGNTLASNDGKGLVERYKNMHASEVIVVFGGSNDYYDDVPLGAPDSNKKDDFYGALKKLCSGLKTTYPNSYIVFLTPLHGHFLGKYNSGNNDAQSSMWDYVQAIKDVCGANSIPVIDLYNNFKIDGDNFEDYTYDGLHPNEDGHKAIAQALESYLKSLM